MTASCTQCHKDEHHNQFATNGKSWKIDRKNISFDHNLTQFPLRGVHQDVNCVTCHPSLVFSEAEPECMSCHTDIHEQTVGFECGRCHTTSSWIVSDIIDIHRHSRFPLLGAHVTADCYDCHKTASLLRFDPLGVECIDCHRDKYLAATSPNHVEGGYSTDCSECHQMNSFTWTGPNFTHSFFPLTGGHAISDCSRCHTDPNDYSNISPDCFSCHSKDYNSTTQPNHQQAGLSTNCASCHKGDYDNTPNTCVGCHQSDYDQTTNPPHASAQFSTDCSLCHTETVWIPSTFDHDGQYFPIYSGNHNGEWELCSDCHTTPGNYSAFSCIDCHDHNKANMDEEHSDVSDYVYNSIACLDCHPNGREDFNKTQTKFKIR
ncbi:MAG TPA: hypothetical protein ENH02_01030 [Bacteroidetes bacterium]|nr:hypothetical protein [Bacteroidota bacterium]